MKRIFLLVLMFSMFASVVYADKCISGNCQNGKGTITLPDEEGTKIIPSESNVVHDNKTKKISPFGSYETQDNKTTESGNSAKIEEIRTQQPTGEESDTTKILKIFENINDFSPNSNDTDVQAKARERKHEKALVQINAKYKGTRLTLQRVYLFNVTSNWNNGKETGKYDAVYYLSTLPGEQSLVVTIIKTYPNENSVINLQKGSISPLTGTIRSVSIGVMGIWIHLE